MTKIARQIARNNRLRHRAALLSARAMDVIDQPGQLTRALRIHERSERAARRADQALRSLCKPSA